MGLHDAGLQDAAIEALRKAAENPGEAHARVAFNPQRQMVFMGVCSRNCSVVQREREGAFGPRFTL